MAAGARASSPSSPGSSACRCGYAIAAALLPDVAGTLRSLYGAEVAGTLAFRPGWALSGLAIALARHRRRGRRARSGASPTRRSSPAGTRRAGASWAARRARRPGRRGRGPPPRRPRARALGPRPRRRLRLPRRPADRRRAAPAPRSSTAVLRLGAAPAPAARSPQWALGRRAGRAAGPLARPDGAAPRHGRQRRRLDHGLSFRQTFVGFLDQRLAAELFVEAPSEAALAAAPARRAPASCPSPREPATLAGAPGEVAVLRDDPTYRDNWRFLEAAPDAWDRFVAGEGAARQRAARPPRRPRARRPRRPSPAR